MVDNLFAVPESDAATPRYQPLVVVLSACCAGILVDRFWPQSAGLWWLVAATCWSVWLLLWRRGLLRVASLVLLMSLASTAAAWHHVRWSIFSGDELGLCAREQDQPVCVEAIALNGPIRLPAPPPNPLRPIAKGEASQLLVSVRRVRDGTSWRRSSGKSLLTVDGHLPGVRAGDRLRIFSSLSAPAAPANPGQFDSAGYQRAHRRLCQLYSGYPDSVTVTSRGRWWMPRRWLNDVRADGQRQLQRHVGPQRWELASAILLGSREQLDREQTEDFFVTGSVHLLAISGLHVGILAAGFLLLGRCGMFSRRWSLLATIAFVILYALLTHARPPVVRAAILVIVVCTAQMLGRRALAFNSLAAAALVVLAFSPAQLLQSGTQLSFLAVGTLACCRRWLVAESIVDPLDRLIAQQRPWPLRAMRQGGAWIARLVTASTLIWLVALPLILYRFHLFSPSAVLLNPIVWIPIAVALYSGFGVLLFGWLAPPLGGLCGSVCDGSLAAIESCVHSARQIEGSYYWSSGPAGWWVIGFYAGLGLLAAWPRLRPRWNWRLALLAAWIAVGVGWSHRTSAELGLDRRSLHCTFVSVGHGTSVLLELPGDRTLLYDAGRLGPTTAGARAVAGVLWSRGITHLDAVVVSHADVDHYNALPELLERVSIGVVYVSPVMFEENSAALLELRRSIEAEGVPIREVFAGDRLATPAPVLVEVLHPPRRGVIGSDNANSIVLSIDYAGRRILLPGDLESPGLDDVLAEEPLHCDVVMAPHHGSARSNPSGFAAWTRPRWVVISGGHGSDLGDVTRAYRAVGADVLHTAEVGAVRATIYPDGALHVSTWRNGEW